MCQNPTAHASQKENLAKMLVAERIRAKNEQVEVEAERADGVAQHGGNSNSRKSAYDDSGWTPPPESWTQADFGMGRGRGARVTPAGTVLSMIRIRPRYKHSAYALSSCLLVYLYALVTSVSTLGPRALEPRHKGSRIMKVSCYRGSRLYISFTLEA